MNLNLMEALQTQTTFFQVELRVLSFGCCAGRGGGAEGGGSEFGYSIHHCAGR